VAKAIHGRRTEIKENFTCNVGADATQGLLAQWTRRFGILDIGNKKREVWIGENKRKSRRELLGGTMGRGISRRVVSPNVWMTQCSNFRVACVGF